MTLIRRAATGTLAITLLWQATVTSRASDLIEGLARYAMHDDAGAIEVLRPLADRGDATAQEVVGKIYLAGDGIRRDQTRAFEWLRQAAAQGRVEAQLQL